jgi:hypothetical protein
MRNACRILMQQPESKITFGKPRRGGNRILKRDVKK